MQSLVSGLLLVHLAFGAAITYLRKLVQVGVCLEQKADRSRVLKGGRVPVLHQAAAVRRDHGVERLVVLSNAWQYDLDANRVGY